MREHGQVRQRGGAAGKRSTRTAREKRGFRPNPRRQLVYTLVTLAVLLGGYALGIVLKKADLWPGDRPAGTAALETAPKGARPWYRSQSPPPTFITIPDAPLFPEPTGEPAGEPVRAYEEALPGDVYVAPARPPEGGAGQHFGGPAVPGPPPAAGRGPPVRRNAGRRPLPAAAPAPRRRPRAGLPRRRARVRPPARRWARGTGARRES